MTLTLTQKKALAIIPHLTGAMSMFGSGCIIRQVLNSRHKRSMTYHRILLGMSFCDLITSFWYFLSTWPIPEGTPGIYAAVGTKATCTAQGFFVQFGLSTPMYNASLSLYYMFVGALRWDETQIQYVEPYMHAIPLVMGFGTAIAGIPLKLFNNANLWCWIAPFPLGCKDSFRNGGETNCVRGDNSWIYRWAFFYGPLWTCILVAMIAMAVVYWAVLKQEKAVDRFQADGIALRKRSRRVAAQAFWYIIAFYASWIAATLKRLFQTIPATQQYNPFIITLLMATFTPMQGFLNFMVYTRSRYVKFRRAHPRTSAVVVLGRAAFPSTKKRRTTHRAPESPDQQNHAEVRGEANVNVGNGICPRDSLSARSKSLPVLTEKDDEDKDCKSHFSGSSGVETESKGVGYETCPK